MKSPSTHSRSTRAQPSDRAVATLNILTWCLGAAAVFLAPSASAEEAEQPVASDERQLEPLPPEASLHASSEFSGGTIELNTWVYEGFAARPGGAPRNGERRRPPGGGGFGGGMRKGGGMGDEMMRRGGGSGGRMPEQNAPPKLLILELTNHGSAATTVEVIDFKSDFGNFAVRPVQMTIEPGESVRAEPMLSRLQVSGEEFPLEVRLVVGDATEEQTLQLRAEAPPTKPGPEAEGVVDPSADKDPDAPSAPENQ